MLGIKKGILKTGEEDSLSDVQDEEEEAPPSVKSPAAPPVKSSLSFMYRNAVADDPKLAAMNITSMEELHAAMAKLSADMEPDLDGSYWKQVRPEHYIPKRVPEFILLHLNCR